MLGVCAEAEQATSHVITTRIPERAQQCRGKYDRFMVTFVHKGGEIARQSGWVVSYHCYRGGVNTLCRATKG